MQNTNRPQGKWILVGKTESRSNILKCTNCNRIRRGRPYSPFCPDCGAEMTKGECNDIEPSLEIKIGDEIITSTGRRGFVDSICDCERCAERGFYEPTIRTASGDIIYMTDSDKKNGFRDFYQIGSHILGNLHVESAEDDYKWYLKEYEDAKKKFDDAKQALELVRELKTPSEEQYHQITMDEYLESLANGK